jgi:enterochelin esterase-like enzyme
MAHKLYISFFLSLATLAFGDEPITPALPPSGFSSSQANIPKGTVSNAIQYPTRNHGNRPVRIYTPPGYSATAATKYPVLYLLHGIGGNESAWNGSEGNANHVLDGLISKNLAKPMIVVMPMGNMTGSTGTGSTWDRFEDVLKNDLIKYVESNYAASSDSNMRAIAGLSWGGGQALNYGFRNHTLFTYIGGFSPAPYMSAPATVIPNPANVDRIVNFCFISSGTNEVADGYGTRAASHHNFWNTNNIAPHMYTIEQGVGHEPANWNRNLYHFAQKLFTTVPSGITLQPHRNGKRAQIGFGHDLHGNAYGSVITGWNEKGIFTVDGRGFRISSEVPMFKSLQAQ